MQPDKLHDALQYIVGLTSHIWCCAHPVGLEPEDKVEWKGDTQKGLAILQIRFMILNSKKDESMRLAFISDLHSCLDALDTVLADAKSREVDEVICLGDLIDMGPQPSEVVDRIREQQIFCIRGNHDSLDENPEIEFLRDLEDWTRSQLSLEQQKWLSNLPFKALRQVDGIQLLLVHGSPDSITQGLVAETPAQALNDWLTDAGADAIFAGHTHVPMVRRVAEGLVVNVGSTAMPFKEPMPAPPQATAHSDYAIVDIHNGSISVEQRRLPLDLVALKAAVQRSGQPHGEILLGTYGTL